MKTQEQAIKDFEDCIAFQKSVGEDTRGVENDLKNNLWHYENKGYYICTKCKRPETANYSNNERMVERQLCFGCNLWEKRLEEDFTKDNVFIYNRTMYSIGTYGISKDDYLGHSGTVFKITYPDDKEVVSNNVWCGGDLPFWLTDGFKTAGSAFEWYKALKYDCIKETAGRYLEKGLISEQVYDALLNYKIECPHKSRLCVDDSLPYPIELKDSYKEVHTFHKISDLLGTTGLTGHQMRHVFSGEVRNGWRMNNLSSKDIKY